MSCIQPYFCLWIPVTFVPVANACTHSSVNIEHCSICTYTATSRVICYFTFEHIWNCIHTYISCAHHRSCKCFLRYKCVNKYRNAFFATLITDIISYHRINIVSTFRLSSILHNRTCNPRIICAGVYSKDVAVGRQSTLGIIHIGKFYLDCSVIIIPCLRIKAITVAVGISNEAEGIAGCGDVFNHINANWCTIGIAGIIIGSDGDDAWWVGLVDVIAVGVGICRCIVERIIGTKGTEADAQDTS